MSTNNNKPETTNWLKVYIIDILPCISLLLYALGIIYNRALFGEFNINILEFVSLTDLFISILDALVAFCTYSLIALILIVYAKTFFSNVSPNESIDNNSKHSLKVCFLSILIMSISFSMDIFLWEYDILKTDLSGAAFALFLPLYFVLGFAIVEWSSSRFKFMSSYKYNLMRKYNTIETFEMLVIFVFYAIVVFSYTGKKTGEYILTHKTETFEIKTSDNTVYNDTRYKIISIFNDRLFLYDIPTEQTVILNRGNITYIRKDRLNESSDTNSIMPLIIDKAKHQNSK